MASSSLVRICGIQQLPCSGLTFYVRRLVMVSGRSSRASLALLQSAHFFRMGLSVILRVVIVQFATLNHQNAQYCFLYSYIIISHGPGSSVGIATGYGLDVSGIESQWGRDFLHLSRPALGPTQPPVQWTPGLSRG